ncbi:MAG: hypothetical protein AAFZ07_19650 [Actinomycetota bacterium]
MSFLDQFRDPERIVPCWWCGSHPGLNSDDEGAPPCEVCFGTAELTEDGDITRDAISKSTFEQRIGIAPPPGWDTWRQP